jgi:hypothetical protein
VEVVGEAEQYSHGQHQNSMMRALGHECLLDFTNHEVVFAPSILGCWRFG